MILSRVLRFIKKIKKIRIKIMGIKFRSKKMKLNNSIKIL